MNKQAGRRRFLIAGGTGLAAASVLPRAAAASRVLSEAERANIQLVKDFMAGWNTQQLDIDAHVAKYIAADAPVRWSDDTPVRHGAAEAAAAAKADMPPGSFAIMEIRDIFAYGPLVAVAHVDTVKVPGKADIVFDAAGCAIVRNGMIVEYSDYLVR